jgi:outer membrane lipoprotein-sorting protein
MKESLLGSSLCYADVLENFFAWEHQAIVGNEVLDRASCLILESKPGKGDRVTYPKVRSWIDTKRMVPLRVEKYADSGKLAKRIDTTRVAKDDTGRTVAASFSLQRPGQDSLTEIEGSNSKHDVTFTDGDFTPEALRILK